MSLFKDFSTNQDKEKTGIWVEYSPNEDGSVPRFRIARLGGANRRAAVITDRVMKPFARQIQLNTLRPEKAEELDRHIFCEACLLDWQGVQDANGQEIPYSFENAIDLFTQLPDLFTDLKLRSMQAASFRDEQLDGDSKN
jgi:hypothetical protein